MTATSKDGLLLEEQLCFALYAASRAMTQAYQAFLEPLRLTYPQYLVMLVLWEEDNQTVGAIGDRLDLDSGTLTPLLKRLETAGQVVRRRSPDDERRVVVSLSAAGRAMKQAAAEMRRTMVGRLGTALAEAADLRDRLRRLTASLHELADG